MRAFVPVIVPLVLGVVVWILGHPPRATVLWALALVVLVLVLLGVPVERSVARAAEKIAHWVGVVATGLVGVILIGFGALLRLVGRDPLTPRRRRGNEWAPAASAASSRRLATAPFGLEPGRVDTGDVGGVGRLARATVFGIGLIATLLLVDLGIGLGYERLTSSASGDSTILDAINFTGRQRTVADVRATKPAMAAYPWADEYFREIQLARTTYWPFTESRPLRFDGKYVHIDGWERRSYEPADLPSDAPVVWMFGGSTTWGEGQRDDFTIASYLSRIADDAGTPITVRNFGQRAWTHFQEMVLFEQLLADEPAPDVVIFYDGANEINAQTLDAKGVPTHMLVNQYAELISGGIDEEVAGAPNVGTPGPLEQSWTAYTQHSAVRKVVNRLRDLVDPPAGASAATIASGEDAHDFGQDYVKTEHDAQNAIEVYLRGRDLSDHLARTHDVEPLFFWQPVLGGSAEKWASDHMTGPTINISGALDGQEQVFIDGGHTNEVGARIVAERIWSDLAPKVGGRASRGEAPSTTAPSS